MGIWMQIYIQPVLLREYSKSFAVTGLPSDHFASFLKWNVYVFPSSFTSFFEFRFTKKIFSVFFTHSTIITVSIIYFVYYVKILTHLLYYFIIFQQLYVLFFYKKTNKLHKGGFSYEKSTKNLHFHLLNFQTHKKHK